jgi:hypothetical protein
MKISDLKNINKLYFGYEDLARAMKVSPSSGMVSASRYVKAGLMLRLKRNLYILRDRWERLDFDQFLNLANLIQTPSYISLMTALGYYQLTTQIQRDFFESIALKRTKTVSIEDAVFNYTKINPELYNGFRKQDSFFIAIPEKAILDALYLKLLGRYNFDLPSVHFEKFDTSKINELLKSFPPSLKKMVNRNEYFGTARKI